MSRCLRAERSGGIGLMAAALVLVACVACGGGTVTDAPGASTPPVDTTKPPTTVQRASITVRVTVDLADANLAQLAGISVSGLTVRLTSSRAGDPARTAVTAADGTVRFENLLEGVYSASVERALTAAELQQLPVGDREASLFAGGTQMVLSPPANRTVDVPLVGARRGSVIISEIFANYGPLQFTDINYVFGSYLELYNNSDTTAYLDGMLLLKTPGNLHGSDTFNGACTDLPKVLRLDSTAVYSTIVLGFPGTGRDYPIRPGEAKVVAMDAINHQIAAPAKEQVDLSRADFEQFWTDADVDNPFAVNMTRVFGSSAGVFGRGIDYFSGRLQHVLLAKEARTTATETSITGNSANGPTTVPALRVPSAHILDLVALEYNPASFGYENASALCTPFTAPLYDRAPAPLVHGNQRKSITRRSLGWTADGREILQRTRTSSRDFGWADPLRRSLSK